MFVEFVSPRANPRLLTLQSKKKKANRDVTRTEISPANCIAYVTLLHRANCVSLKPRAVQITRLAKVNFVFQFDCNRGGSVRA